MDVTIICLAVLVSAVPDGPDAALPSSNSQPFYQAAESWDEVVIRAQSADSPYYDELPPSGGSLPQYPYTPTAPSYPAPGSTLPGNPPTFGDPSAVPGGYGAPGDYGSPVGPAPYDPFLGQMPPGTAPANGAYQYGVNGPKPYRFGPQPRVDVGYIAPASATNGYHNVEVFEFDSDMPIASPLSNGDVFTFTPQFDMRLFDGPTSPPGAPGFPNDLYRFGWDFSYAWKDPMGAWSGELAFNPSINTDFEKSLTIDSVNWDARGIAFFQASPTLTVALGALYWDRVDDRILPYAGVIWLPNDRWELRLVFPEPRISYFAGYMWGKPTWVYARAEYDVEAYEVEVPEGQHNQLEMRDWRFLIGARKEQGWGESFIEAGWVFDRKVEYAHTAPGFNMGEAFIFRSGLRF
ncbi:MAG: hypothetical protein M3552_21095 [Planctomycetota bacterium]|nr:hypothetical protein [Planctomycetaceae bacterium]MDQ3333111.1 hypothetical protein [Planctomycetota bacterium]